MHVNVTILLFNQVILFTIIELFNDGDEINHHGSKRYVGNQQLDEKVRHLSLVICSFRKTSDNQNIQTENKMFGKWMDMMTPNIYKMAKNLGKLPNSIK